MTLGLEVGVITSFKLCLIFHSPQTVLVYSCDTVPVNKSGVTLLGLVVHEGNLEIFRYLVNEEHVNINGEPTNCCCH